MPDGSLRRQAFDGYTCQTAQIDQAGHVGQLRFRQRSIQGLPRRRLRFSSTGLGRLVTSLQSVHAGHLILLEVRLRCHGRTLPVWSWRRHAVCRRLLSNWQLFVKVPPHCGTCAFRKGTTRHNIFLDITPLVAICGMDLQVTSERKHSRVNTLHCGDKNDGNQMASPSIPTKTEKNAATAPPAH